MGQTIFVDHRQADLHRAEYHELGASGRRTQENRTAVADRGR